jgi:replication-associated recombination protein RarA
MSKLLKVAANFNKKYANEEGMKSIQPDFMAEISHGDSQSALNMLDELIKKTQDENDRLELSEIKRQFIELQDRCEKYKAEMNEAYSEIRGIQEQILQAFAIND